MITMQFFSPWLSLLPSSTLSPLAVVFGSIAKQISTKLRISLLSPGTLFYLLTTIHPGSLSNLFFFELCVHAFPLNFFPTLLSPHGLTDLLLLKFELDSVFKSSSSPSLMRSYRSLQNPKLHSFTIYLILLHLNSGLL